MNSQLRIRLIDEAEGDSHTITLSKIPIEIPGADDGSVSHPLSAEQHERNMCRERKIFVKAALQLLESHERENFASVVAPAETADDPKFDLIRSGFLWKGSKTAMARSGINARATAGGGHHWKSKYIELRHGQFSYYDDEADESPLVTSSTHSYHVNFSASKRGAQQQQQQQQLGTGRAGNLPVTVGAKKVIPLSAETCVCRIVALDVGEVMTGRSPAPFFWQHQHNAGGAAGAGAESAGAGTARSAAAVVPAAFTPTSSSGNLEALAAARTEGGGGRDGRCAFEVSVLGGQRRLFLASSAAECDAWVTAINIAMGGKKVVVALQGRLEGDAEDRHSTASAVDAVNLGVEIPAPSARRNSRSTQPLPGLLGAAAGMGEAAGGVEGAVGPYARNVADYISWQEHLHSLNEERDFRAAMRAFIDGSICLSVPVAYVKGKCADSRFRGAQQSVELGVHPDGQNGKHGGILAGGRHWLSAGHKKSHHAAAERRPSAVTSRALQKEVVCVEKSQMWKDLQRDEVSVNGERVCGTSGSLLASPPGATVSQDQVGGAEAIVGVLVRHIADAVDAAKSELVRLLKERQECDPSAHPSIDVVQEAQVVQCARNVLMMCNRTQSGGDTYYCVDTLLNRARGLGGGDIQSSLFVLAPVSNSADPLEIVVDVVETAKSNFFSEDWVDANGAATLHRTGAAQAPLDAFPGDAGAEESRIGTPSDVEQYRPSEWASTNSEDFIDAIVASTGALSSSSPPAHQPARAAETLGRARQEQLATSDAGAARAAQAPAAKGGRAIAATGTKNSVVSPSSVAPGRGGFTRSSSAASNRSGRRFSAVSPQNAKAQDGATPSSSHAKKADEGSIAGAQEGVGGGAGLDSSAFQRRGSGRRSQLKLSIDDEASNCDNDGSPACQPYPSRGDVNGRSGSAQESSVDEACDATNSGDRDDCDADDEDTAKGLTSGGVGIAFAAVSTRGVPLSVMCLSDGEEDDGAAPSALIGASLTSTGHHYGKDDSTVISDITFDTTAGFSQSTTLAQYQRPQPGAVTPVALHRGDGSDAAAGYGSVGKQPATHHKPKSLLKMIASRLTPKPGAAMTPTGADGMGTAPSPVPQSVSAMHSRTVNHATSPRFRGGAANTFLAATSSDGADQPVETHRFGSYFSGGAKKKVHMFSEQKHGAQPEAGRLQAHHQPALSGDASSAASGAPRPCLCVRLQVRGVSRYRVCSADPQGDPEEDNWATMVGTFRQTFLIPACAAAAHLLPDAGTLEGPSAVGVFDRCRLALTDRVVSITAEKFSADL